MMETRRRGRGPSSPSFGLEQAVQAISKIERLYSKNTMTRGEAGSAMGFSGSSGHTKRWVATLSQFGLLERRGTGSVGVTDLAKRVLFPTSSEEKVSAVTEVLTRPRVFEELLGSFPNPELVTQEVVNARLRRDGSFTEASARSTAKVFVDSITYLETVKEDAQVDGVEESGAEDQRVGPLVEPIQPELDSSEQSDTKESEGFKELCLAQLGPDTSVRILVNGPLGPNEFTILLRILEVQQEALIGASDNSQQAPHQSEARGAE